MEYLRNSERHCLFQPKAALFHGILNDWTFFWASVIRTLKLLEIIFMESASDMSRGVNIYSLSVAFMMLLACFHSMGELKQQIYQL